jgi:hypothetical protein
MNKSFYAVLFLVLSFKIFSQEYNGLLRPEPIYGEENAPDTIYYKYIHNNPSNTFLYSVFNDKDYNKNDVTVFFIVSIENNDGVLLVYSDDTIYQYSILYNTSQLVPGIIYSLYWVKNRPDDAIYADVQHFLLRQFNFIYKLIHKNDLEQILDSTLSNTCQVYVDNYNLESPYYIRKKED